MIPTDTAERIFSLLDEKGMEQKALALALGTTDKTVSTWRTGRTKSYTKYLSQIAEILGTTVNYLLTGEKNEPATVSSDRPAGLDDIDAIYQKLSPQDREALLRIARGLAAGGQQK